jgi:hypothetical protein
MHGHAAIEVINLSSRLRVCDRRTGNNASKKPLWAIYAYESAKSGANLLALVISDWKLGQDFWAQRAHARLSSAALRLDGINQLLANRVPQALAPWCRKRLKLERRVVVFEGYGNHALAWLFNFEPYLQTIFGWKANSAEV